MHVDHIIELSEGGAAYDMRNLQTLCRECHNRKRAGLGRKHTSEGEPTDPNHHWNTEEID